MELTDKRLKLTKNRVVQMQELGIHSGEELLTYYPFRYEILKTSGISTWREGDKITFEGEVVSAVKSWRYGRNRTVAKFEVMADGEIFQVTIFNRPWAKQLRLNEVITISGVYNGKHKITAVSYKNKPLDQLPLITPVYSAKEGITQRTISECIRHTLEGMAGEISDLIPEDLRQAYRLQKRVTALKWIHFPEDEYQVTQAYRTLKYEEFLRFFLAVQMIKNQVSSQVKKKRKVLDYARINSFIDHLHFELTPDQMKAVTDILNDMESEKVMYRLVQGDVGCGKTIVAAVALYAAVTAGYQGALLAPTEILAQQHHETIRELLGPLGIRVELLYSGEKAARKKEIIQAVSEGLVDILIGTHSILQENVIFANAGLVIADEQQRFGVEQRRTLREKGQQIDFLLMSATPIPRTLASTLYGDMDISTIETMPAGRKPVITTLIRENSFRSVLPDVKTVLERGNQLYVICAAVEQSDDYPARDVEETAKTLSKLFAGTANVGVLHGRMSSEEKQSIMEMFYRNEIQVLVSTTVVEVGMNVVNATGMIVYDADRFGLSQLHQLRGRIQRGSTQGQCWLLTSSNDADTLARLEVLVKTSNGFEISYEDLRLRGPGDILGTRQSGLPDFILGNIIEDTNILNTARKDAEMIYNNRNDPAYQAILQDVERRNERNFVIID